MSDAEEQVILVDEHDVPVGTGGKLPVHQQEGGVLHRAVSVFVFNPEGELLLQKRAATKYHSAGLWANTCCGHPRPGEDMEAAAHRRLREELGFDCPLEKRFDFIYQVELNNGFWEYEFDHVFVGTYVGVVLPNPDEVTEIAWEKPEVIAERVKNEPETFAPWFPICFPRVHSMLQENKV